MLYGSVGRVGLRAISGTSFSPLSLFANGEQGVWLDNSDFTTLFQDAAGTTPVTGYEQFVGLRLDKSKGLVLGSNVITNGDFSSSTGWTISNPTITIGSDVCTFSGAPDTASVYQSVGAQGAFVAVTYTIVSRTSGGFAARAGGNNGATRTAPGTYTDYVYAASSNNVGVVAVGTTSGVIDNVSARLLPGNHAYQTNINARAVLSARYNQLTYTEQFDNAAWSRTELTVASDQTSAPDGTSTADLLAETANSNAHQIFPTVSMTTGVAYTAVFHLKKGPGSTAPNWARLAFRSGAMTTAPWANFNISTGVVGNTSGAGITASITELPNGWYRCAVTATADATSANGGGYVQLTNNTDTTASTVLNTYTGATTSNIYIWGADLRAANESSALPTYQRVGAAVNGTSTVNGVADYDTVSFPAYLRYDGGDWYQTGSIDFSAGATNPPLGPELVTNGDFSNGSTGWTLGPGVSVSGGLLVFTGLANNTTQDAVALSARGKFVSVTYTIVSRTSGSLAVFTQQVSPTVITNFTTYRAASGTYTELLYIPPNAAFFGFNTSNFVGTVDNISVKEINQLYAPDKMSVFSGVRKLDTADSAIAELSVASSGNTGTFAFFANNSGNSNYFFRSHGTISSSVITPNTYPAPITNVLTGLGNISADDNTIRVNGLQVAQSTADQGTGTFGNYPLYLGARGGGSLFFTGREYETIVLGRAVTATELANTEDYMETQTFGKDMAYVYSDELTTATGDQITAADGDPIYMTVQYI